MFGSLRLLLAAALAVVMHQSAGADTFYELGRVDGDVHALDSAVSETGAILRTATYYRVTGSHVAHKFIAEVDCAAKRVRMISRKVMRSDLSPLRDTPVNPDWQTPDGRAIGGILVRAVCALPTAPSGLRRTDAGTTAEYLQRTSNEVLAAYDPSKRLIIADSTVGDCIFGKLPAKLKEDAIFAVQDGKPPMAAAGFSAQVDKLGAVCSGRPERQGDSLVVGAAVSIFQRFGIMSLLADSGKIAEDHLVAAWHTAPAEVRAPLLQQAAMLHDPSVTATEILQLDQEPIKRSTEVLMNSPFLKPRLDALSRWSGAQKQQLVQRYFVGLAMGEVAESRMLRVF